MSMVVKHQGKYKILHTKNEYCYSGVYLPWLFYSMMLRNRDCKTKKHYEKPQRKTE